MSFSITSIATQIAEFVTSSDYVAAKIVDWSQDLGKIVGKLIGKAIKSTSTDWDNEHVPTIIENINIGIEAGIESALADDDDDEEEESETEDDAEEETTEASESE